LFRSLQVKACSLDLHVASFGGAVSIFCEVLLDSRVLHFPLCLQYTFPSQAETLQYTLSKPVCKELSVACFVFLFCRTSLPCVTSADQFYSVCIVRWCWSY